MSKKEWKVGDEEALRWVDAIPKYVFYLLVYYSSVSVIVTLCVVCRDLLSLEDGVNTFGSAFHLGLVLLCWLISSIPVAIIGFERLINKVSKEGWK